MVNPLGTVTTTVSHASAAIPDDEDDFDQFMFHGDAFIHENCDEALFRPVVAVFGSTGRIGARCDDAAEAALRQQAPADIGQSLVVPVTELKQPAPKKKDVAKPVPLKERKKSDTKRPTVDGVVAIVDAALHKAKDAAEQPVAGGGGGGGVQKMSKKAQRRAAEAAKMLETMRDEMDVLIASEPRPIAPESVIVSGLVAIRKNAEMVAAKLATAGERKISDTTKPIDPSAVFEQSAECGGSKKAQRKATEAAKCVEPVSAPDAEMALVKPKKNKSRRNSSIKSNEFPIDTVLVVEQMPGKIVASAIAAQLEDDFYAPTNMVTCNLDDMVTKEVFHRDYYPADEEPSWVEPPVAAVRSSKKSKAKTIEALTVIECFEQEYASIQDSIFVDPVVTSTVVVKKSARKAKPLAAAIIETSPMQEDPPAEALEPAASGSARDSDSVELEFVDAFAPLEPFELNFEHVPDEHDATLDDFVSLINFTSPQDEEPTEAFGGEMPATKTRPCVADYSPFQSCVEFVEQDDIDDDDDVYDSEEPPVLLYECQDSDYKSLEQEIDESYLSLDQPPALIDEEDAVLPVGSSSLPISQSNSSSTSSGDESSSQLTATTTSINVPVTAAAAASTEHVTTYKQTDDEELQPLIERSVLNQTLMDESLYVPQSTVVDVELGRMLDESGDPTEEESPDAKPRLPAAAGVGRPSKKSRRKRR